MLARYMLSSCVCPLVSLSVCRYVCSSVTKWYCIETTRQKQLVLAWELPLTRPKLCYKEILVPPVGSEVHHITTRLTVTSHHDV